jgi:hypothetical protein
MLVTVLIGGCSGGDNSAPDTDALGITVAGAGVKGPLAGAVVNLYQVDLSATDLKGSRLDQGSTDAAAAIEGLSLPSGTTGLVLVEVVADTDTTDITSGDYPVLDTLYTVVDAQRIIDGDEIYATPLTTMAVALAHDKADSGLPFGGDGDSRITQAEFLTAETDTTEEQTAVAKNRQAIEALTAVALQLATDSSASDTAQQILDALVEDLGDGKIDGQNDTDPVPTLAALDTTLTAVDLASLTIPGTTIPVSDIEDELVYEMEVTGATTDITDLEEGTIAVDPAMPELIADSDGDGTDDSCDAFPNDPSRTTLTAPVLDAVAAPSTVTLTWNEESDVTYKLYYATAPDCDVANYTNCPGGTMVANVNSPHVVSDLVNGAQTRDRLAAIGTDGSLASWDPDADNDVFTLSVAGSTVYASGNFNNIGGVFLPYLTMLRP